MVTIALVLAVRFTSWGLSMRAMSENADSARLSGVWIRRTSTLTWTVAGALSAFTAILNAPEPDERPDPGPVARPAAFRPDRRAGGGHDQPHGGLHRRRRGGRVPPRCSSGTSPSPAKQQLILFVVVMAGPARPGRRPAQGGPPGERSTWRPRCGDHVARPHGPLRSRVSTSRASGPPVAVAALLPLVLSVGNDVPLRARSASTPSSPCR